MKDLWAKIRSGAVTAKLKSVATAAAAGWNRHKMSIIKNVAISVAAISLLGGLTVAGHHYVKSNTIEIYHVYFADQHIGTVSDPAVVEQFVIEKTRDIVAANPHAHMVVNSDQISYKSEKKFKGEFNDEEAVLAVGDHLSAKAIGVELIIDGQVYAIVKDQETADELLAQIQSQYISEQEKRSGEVQILSVSAEPEVGQAELQSVGFVEEVKTKSIETQPDAIEAPELVLERIQTGGVKPTKYIVREGDTILGIARKFELTAQQIYDRNPWIENDFLQIGDELDLTVLQPDLTVRTEEIVVEEIPVGYETEYINDDTMRKGTTKVVQQGQDGLKKVTYLVTKLNGEMSNEELIDEVVLVEPVKAIVRRGTMVVKGVGSGSFSWPVKNAKISSKYGARWGTTHRGIDITSSDKKIKAADNGKVSFAGTQSSYGNVVIIDHGNGYETVYAHLKSYSVKKGDVVQKGDQIGIMGSTGHSTGVHLHFEVRKNGKHQNPLSYLK
jgi:murein DD-endopeptidase MepM/ murein hydrolase activator NlpD